MKKSLLPALVLPLTVSGLAFPAPPARVTSERIIRT